MQKFIAPREGQIPEAQLRRLLDRQAYCGVTVLDIDGALDLQKIGEKGGKGEIHPEVPGINARYQEGGGAILFVTNRPLQFVEQKLVLPTFDQIGVGEREAAMQRTIVVPEQGASLNALTGIADGRCQWDTLWSLNVPNKDLLEKLLTVDLINSIREGNPDARLRAGCNGIVTLEKLKKGEGPDQVMRILEGDSSDTKGQIDWDNIRTLTTNTTVTFVHKDVSKADGGRRGLQLIEQRGIYGPLFGFGDLRDDFFSKVQGFNITPDQTNVDNFRLAQLPSMEAYRWAPIEGEFKIDGEGPQAKVLDHDGKEVPVIRAIDGTIAIGKDGKPHVPKPMEFDGKPTTGSGDAYVKIMTRLMESGALAPFDAATKRYDPVITEVALMDVLLPKEVVHEGMKTLARDSTAVLRKISEEARRRNQ